MVVKTLDLAHVLDADVHNHNSAGEMNSNFKG